MRSRFISNQKIPLKPTFIEGVDNFILAEGGKDNDGRDVHALIIHSFPPLGQERKRIYSIRNMNIVSKLNKKTSIKTGVILTYLTLLVSLVISFFYPPFLLKTVGSTNNGLLQFATSVISFVLLLSFGVENSYVRFATIASEDRDKKKLAKLNGFYLIVFGLIAVLELLVGVLLSFLYLNGILTINGSYDKTTLFWLLLIISISYSLDFFLSIFNWHAYFLNRFGWTQGLSLLNHVVTVLCSVLALIYGGNVIYVALATAICLVVYDAANVFFAKNKLKMTFLKPEKEEFRHYFKDVFSFSAFIFLTIAVGQINSNFGKLILGSMVSPEAVTIYSYGLQFYIYENVMALAISKSFSPRINEYVVAHEDNKVSSLFLKASKLQMFVLFLVAGGFLSCGLPFIKQWLSSSDLTPNGLTSIFILGASFLFLWLLPLSETVGVEVQRANNKHHFIATNNIVFTILGAVLAGILIYFLPSEYKVYGPLIGMAFAVIVVYYVLSNVYYVKELSLPIGKFFIRFGIMILITGIAWGIPFVVFRYVITLSENMNGYLVALIEGGTFAAIYLLLCLLFFHKELKSYFPKKNKAVQREDIQE